MGYSVGHWDGDTLVIESAGFNDRTWLDGDGHPHTESLRVTERLRRPDFGHLEIERTLQDPKALSQPWIIPIKVEFNADTEMLEYVCAENERDRNHLVGKAADDKSKEVSVSLQILKQYAGVYELRVPPHPEDPLMIDISLEDNQLDGIAQRRSEACSYCPIGDQVLPRRNAPRICQRRSGKSNARRGTDRGRRFQGATKVAPQACKVDLVA